MGAEDGGEAQSQAGLQGHGEERGPKSTAPSPVLRVPGTLANSEALLIFKTQCEFLPRCRPSRPRPSSSLARAPHVPPALLKLRCSQAGEGLPGPGP